MNVNVDQYRHEVHLNLNVRGLPLSPTLEINETSRRLIAEGKEVFRLGLGQSPFPVPEQVVQALRDNAEQKDYLSVRGLEALRVAIADYHNRRYGLTFNWRNIIILQRCRQIPQRRAHIALPFDIVQFLRNDRFAVLRDPLARQPVTHAHPAQPIINRRAPYTRPIV